MLLLSVCNMNVSFLLKTEIYVCATVTLSETNGSDPVAPSELSWHLFYVCISFHACSRFEEQLSHEENIS